MISDNDLRITGIRTLDRISGSAAGVTVAGAGLEIVVSVEVGQTLFATGARFVAGVFIADSPALAYMDANLGDPIWSRPIDRLAFSPPPEVTADLADRLVSVAAFVRINRRTPYLVATLRGADLFVVPPDPEPT